MSIFQKIMNFLFGTEYVILVWYNGDYKTRRAYELGGKVYADPSGKNTRTELLPKGKINGQPYVIGWRPITKKYFNFYSLITD